MKNASGVRCDFPARPRPELHPHGATALRATFRAHEAVPQVQRVATNLVLSSSCHFAGLSRNALSCVRERAQATMPQPLPQKGYFAMIPNPPDDGNWQAWADQHYPFDPRWERFLRTRRHPPQPGSEKQLDDLRGISRVAFPGTAGRMAQLWFHSVQNASHIAEEQRAVRDAERYQEVLRMAQYGRLALQGKLGKTAEDRKNAQATAQQFLGAGDPGRLSYDELHDWTLMHKHQLAIARGQNPKRPVLSRDRRQQAAQRKDLQDIDQAIGAEQGELWR